MKRDHETQTSDKNAMDSMFAATVLSRIKEYKWSAISFDTINTETDISRR